MLKKNKKQTTIWRPGNLWPNKLISSVLNKWHSLQSRTCPSMKCVKGKCHLYSANVGLQGHDVNHRSQYYGTGEKKKKKQWQGETCTTV